MPLASAAITLPDLDAPSLPPWLAAFAAPKKDEAVDQMQFYADWVTSLAELGLEEEAISLCGYRLYQAEYFAKLEKQCSKNLPKNGNNLPRIEALIAGTKCPELARFSLIWFAADTAANSAAPNAS
jgi:hypothetical protein